MEQIINKMAEAIKNDYFCFSNGFCIELSKKVLAAIQEEHFIIEKELLNFAIAGAYITAKGNASSVVSQIEQNIIDISSLNKKDTN